MIVVIGHYPEYLELGRQLQASVFDVGPARWASIDDETRWQLNRDFLDQAMALQATILLATAPERIRPGSFLERELAYLIGRGYKFTRTHRGLELTR